MGVLDDAIREHLELKRKHGVPEEDLRRQEEEALGPVRREVTPPEEAEASGNGETPAEMTEPAAEGTGAKAAEPELAPFDGGARSEEAEPRVDELESEPFAEDAASAVVQDAEPVDPLPELEEPEVTVEPEPDPLELHPERDAAEGTEGSGRFERESHPAESEAGGGTPAWEQDDAELEQESEQAGDVLEDTPDFLEETPEHDRLWFEQKPPRDFDFD